MKKTNPIQIHPVDVTSDLKLEMIEQGISAGFPSPAGDFLENPIDLNKVLIKHPSSTFFARVKGTSMINAGIGDGDLLVIDKSLDPQDGKIAVCYLEGEFTIKKLKKEGGKLYLMPANESYSPIKIEVETDFMIWGIVTTIIKTV